MQFFTPVDIPKSNIQLRHDKGVVLLGSCFADNIGRKLEDAKFNTLQNPFGTLYNPASIAWLINSSITGKRFDEQSSELFSDSDGTWHSWMHHSVFSSPTAKTLADRMNHAGETLAAALQTAGTLIVTFGTAMAYTLRDSGTLVANCHKQDDKLFVRKRLTPDGIAETWKPLILRLREINPNIQIILTVSPIRHHRDGFHTNQISKSILLLAVEQIIETFRDRSEMPMVDYFPSYEIMMDELRDYRFYADDMTHPSPIAIQHIWQRFCDTHMSRETTDIIGQCEKIAKALAHRPSHPDSPAHRKFLANIHDQIETIKNKYPYINLSQETALCNIQLKK